MTKVLIKKDNNPFSVDNFNGVKIKGFDITFWDIEKLYFDFKTIDSSFLSNKSLTDLWKSGDKNYNDFLSNFLQIAKNFDIIYFNIYNPFPPEWVFINLKDKRTIFFVMMILIKVMKGQLVQFGLMIWYVIGHLPMIPILP